MKLCSPGTRARLGALGVGRVRMLRAVKDSSGDSLLKRNKRALKDHLYRWTRAVGVHLARPQGRRWKRGGRSMRAMETTPAASLNVSEGQDKALDRRIGREEQGLS